MNILLCLNRHKKLKSVLNSILVQTIKTDSGLEKLRTSHVYEEGLKLILCWVKIFLNPSPKDTTTVIHFIFAMHAGTKGKSSKNEAAYYPSRSKIIYWLNEHDKNLLPSPEDFTLVSNPNKKVRKRTLKQQKHIFDKCYIKANEKKVHSE